MREIPKRFKYLLHGVLIAIAGLILNSCSKEADEVERKLGFDAFVPTYNNYIKNWLSLNHRRVIKELAEVERKITDAGDAPSKELVSNREDLKRELARIEYRQSMGDYFAAKKPEDIPEGLKWEDGMDQPEIGDPRAKKGGAFRFYITQFPATVRPFGKEANNSFRSRIYQDVEMGLIGLHPKTMKVIPGIAKSWAVSEDGRTVYYELDPDAKYNDGRPIVAKDFQIGIYVRVSDNVTDPFYKQYYREQFAQVATYGDNYVSVSLPESKPLMPYYTNILPESPHFFKDYAADYEEYYQWKVATNAGAYYVKDSDIVKGVSITLTRDKDWWAKDKKYYRHRFNPDKVVFTTIRDDSKTFELFRAGQLDAYFLTRPNYWYQKSEIQPVFDGYIERYKFYTQYPRVPRGAYLNVHRPILNNLDARKGIGHALHWQKVIDVVFQGDYSRLQQFSDGFGEMTNPDIKAREFSIVKARDYFADAGFTDEGPDGILRKPSGERLALNMSYPNVAYYSKVVAILKEEAKKAGMELRADGQESTVFYKTVMKKEHDMVIWGWGATPPFPRYYQNMHSKNAFDSEGEPKPQTNNINSYANDEMDKYCLALRYAQTTEEVKKNAWIIQQMIFDEALFSAGWVTDFVRIGSWRWVRWPDTEETPFNVPIIYEPLESYVLWIDEDMKKETEVAMRSGKKFPEVQKIIDVYKNGIPKNKEVKESQGAETETNPEEDTNKDVNKEGDASE